MGSAKPGFPRPPRHLKLPTPPGEELAHALYNMVRDFFGLIWVRLRLDCYPLAKMRLQPFPPKANP